MAHTITGVVVDAGNAPVPGAQVWLSQYRFPRVTAAGDDGRFTFGEVESGPVQLVARKDGLAVGGTQGQCIDDIDVAIVLDEPDPTRLRIINMRYEPIAGARLKSLVVNDRFTIAVEDLVDYGFPSVRSDDEGFLTIPDLPKRAFVSIAISHPRYVDGRLPALPVGIPNFDFPLADGAKLRGRVVTESGKGIARARVVVYRPLENGQSVQVTEEMTGPEGFFSALAPPGAYSVAARHPAYATPKPERIEVASLNDEKVVNLTMPAPHRLHGKTVDKEGNPVRLAVLSYRSDQYVLNQAVSDATGSFDLVVPEGEGILQIAPPERMVTMLYPRMYVQVPGDMEVIHLDPIRMQALPEIRGHVTTSDEVALDKVLISSLNLEPAIYVTTGANGEFTIRLDRMPDELVRFRAEHALRFLRDEFKIDPVELEAPEIRLRPHLPEIEEDDPERAPNDLSAMVGKPAPEIAGSAWFNLPAGQASLDLASLKGQVVVLTLWAGFDAQGATPDRINELNALYRLLGGEEDVAIVGVHDGSTEPSDIARYVHAFGIKFPVVRDTDSFETFGRYHTHAIPQTVVIDKRGILRHYDVDGRLLELIKSVRRY